jgi:hypothetical protein
VVNDGKRAQAHVTTAKVKTTLNDCRQWDRDATTARLGGTPGSRWRSLSEHG